MKSNAIVKLRPLHKLDNHEPDNRDFSMKSIRFCHSRKNGICFINDLDTFFFREYDGLVKF